MAAESFAKVMPQVFAHEGGYVNDPHDPGGATSLGITARTLGAWRGGGVATPAQVQALGKPEALAIYRAQYWQAIMGDALPAGVDYAVLDFAINSGVARASKALQQAVGASMDGHIGMATVSAALALAPAAVVNKICDARLAFLKGLSTWKRYGGGWGRRVEEVRALALSLASAHTPAIATRVEPSPPILLPELVDVAPVPPGPPQPAAAEIQPAPAPNDAAMPPAPPASLSFSGQIWGTVMAVISGGGASVLSYIQSPYALGALAILVIAGTFIVMRRFKMRSEQGV